MSEPLLAPAWRRAVPPVVAVSAVWVAGWALVVEGTDRPVGIDRPVDSTLASARPALGGVAAVFADMSRPARFAVLVAAVAAVCLLAGCARAVAVLVVALGAELAACEALKVVVDRHQMLGPLTFPSGHVATASTVATVVVLLARRDGPLPRRVGRGPSTALAVAAVVSVPVVAASMILLGDHYFTDTLAAAPLGVAVTLAVTAAADRLAGAGGAGNRVGAASGAE